MSAAPRLRGSTPVPPAISNSISASPTPVRALRPTATLQRSARRCSSHSPRLQLRLVTGGIVLAACLSGFEARAAEPARLEWVRLEGAESCIDAAQLETRVKRRLGIEPFDPRASRSIEGVVQRNGAVWRAQIVVRTRPDDA